MKLGSLFDGSGTFPFAAELDGIDPVFASEIEPFPVLVTHTRFPYMKHLGDVTKINGAEIEPVDILTFGSPCQDLSVAGAQKGLQDGERSSLFFEAIRIIKEMREATNGKYPRIIVFENVPGIFSSQKERDFHEVLKQFVSIVDGADVPRPTQKNGRLVWKRNGCILGDGYSFAWRQLDAQFFGVAQRRKRVFVVGCLDSERAVDLLFNTNRLPRDFAQSERARQRVAENTGRGVDGAERVVSDCDRTAKGNLSDERGFPQSDGKHQYFVFDSRGNGDGHTVCTITGDHNDRVTDYTPLVLFGKTAKPRNKTDAQGYEQMSITHTLNAHDITEAYANDIVVAIEGNGYRPSHQGDGYSTDGVMYTLNSVEQHKVCYAIGIDRAAFNQGKNAQYKPQFNDNLQPSLTAKGPGHHQGVLVCYIKPNIHYIVRRLMPVECARLMGFPDWWCSRLAVENPTEKDMEFCRRVFETYANATGGKMKSDKQIRKWLADPMSDSAQYKMWGNGIVLPVARYIIHACKEALNEQG